MTEVLSPTGNAEMDLTAASTVTAAVTAEGPLPEAVRDRLDERRRSARAESTWAAYADDDRAFDAWCQLVGRRPLPASPETVAWFVDDQARVLREDGQHAVAVATIERRLAALSVRHRLAGHASPTSDPAVSEVLAGVRRDRGVSQDAKRAIWGHELRLMLAATPPAVRDEQGQLVGRSLLGVRDRALLLLTFAMFARRSEVAGARGLRWCDVEVRDDGLVLSLISSKTNQAGPAEIIGVARGADPATCPVRALLAWRSALAEQLGLGEVEALDGPLFRPVTRHGRLGLQGGGGEGDALSAKAVAAVVKRYAAAAGLDPDEVAAHSLRSGAATTASERGAGELALMQQGRWKTVTMVKRYVQQGQALSGSNASRYLGL